MYSQSGYDTRESIQLFYLYVFKVIIVLYFRKSMKVIYYN